MRHIPVAATKTILMKLQAAIATAPAGDRAPLNHGTLEQKRTRYRSGFYAAPSPPHTRYAQLPPNVCSQTPRDSVTAGGVRSALAMHPGRRCVRSQGCRACRHAVKHYEAFSGLGPALLASRAFSSSPCSTYPRLGVLCFFSP
jgi:hypothetical protein